MTVLKVKKIANPRRKNRTKQNRKMTAKQIRFFGSKRQKAALRAARKRKRKANPVRVVVRNRKLKNTRKRRTHRRSNPALVLTLGSVNPRRKRRNKPVAVKARKNRRRRVNSHRRRRRNPVMKVVARRTNKRRRSSSGHRRRRRNPTRVVVVAPRRNRRHRSGHRRRNPSLFGHPMFGKDSLELIGGGIVGVAATKFIPTLIPGSLTGGIGSSNVGRTVITGVSAVIAGYAASHVSPTFGQGVLFGGMMQTLSVALNAFLPSVWTALNPSLGDLVPGQFTVPQNPIRAALPMAAPVMPAAPGAQVRITQSGLGRAFRPAF